MKKKAISSAVAAAAGSLALAGLSGCTTNSTPYTFNEWVTRAEHNDVLLQTYLYPHTVEHLFTTELAGVRWEDLRLVNQNPMVKCAKIEFTDVENAEVDPGRFRDFSPIGPAQTISAGAVNPGDYGWSQWSYQLTTRDAHYWNGSYQCEAPPDGTGSGSESEDCYITTAMCEQTGLPDNCRELQILRTYRDGVLASSDEGRALIEEYYRHAPGIVAAIDRDPARDRIYRQLRETFILPAADAAAAGRNDQALQLYRDMVVLLQSKYL